jgi:hypothetical protein
MRRYPRNLLCVASRHDQIILVDDASSDNTLEVASARHQAIRHRKNRGYGGNQKTCYAKALDEGAEIVVMLHPDYQYDPTIARDIVQPILRGEADVVLASRMLGDPLRGGMPLYKFVANKFLTWMENVVLGTSFSEFHTGYRAYNRHALESVNFEANSENFVFDNEILVQFVIKKIRFKEIPFPHATPSIPPRSASKPESSTGVDSAHHHQVSAVQMGIRQIQAVQLSTCLSLFALPAVLTSLAALDWTGNRSLRTCALRTSETVPKPDPATLKRNT